MSDITKIGASQLSRAANVYLRQSSPNQVEHNRESTQRQYALVTKASSLGWPAERIARLTAEVVLGHVGIVLALEVSRLARNNADWYRLLPKKIYEDSKERGAGGISTERNRRRLASNSIHSAAIRPSGRSDLFRRP
jgi:hypothetical protein